MDRLQQETRKVIYDCTKLSFHLKGAVSYNEMMGMTLLERDTFAQMLSDHYEQEEKAIEKATNRHKVR